MKVYLLSIGIRVIVPLMLGIIIYLFGGDLVFLQLPLFIFGVIGLMIWLAKYNRIDRQNMKEFGTTKMNKLSTEYLIFKKGQRIIFYSSVLNIIFSYLVFFILGE